MELTKKQEEGLRIAVQRHRDHEKYTVIAGYLSYMWNIENLEEGGSRS